MLPKREPLTGPPPPPKPHTFYRTDAITLTSVIAALTSPNSPKQVSGNRQFHHVARPQSSQ
ncbi:hypothetical protein DFR71_6426 [Nocardia alba]|uniref:Uncharacterized protein n=1 Tax=Nocardia alba TaxID=225051 RepID=A0A4R1FD53_9NOCA|nr:hypothetical protein DFR71_6426 [Nocardia alba]